MGTQLLAETLLPHSLSHDCYIKQKHKSDYYQVATASFFRPKIIKCTKIVGGPKSAPDPAGGSSRRSRRLPSRLGRRSLP
jgi:hypothetical protein